MIGHFILACMVSIIINNTTTASTRKDALNLAEVRRPLPQDLHKPLADLLAPMIMIKMKITSFPKIKTKDTVRINVSE